MHYTLCNYNILHILSAVYLSLYMKYGLSFTIYINWGSCQTKDIPHCQGSTRLKLSGLNVTSGPVMSSTSCAETPLVNTINLQFDSIS